MRTVLVDWLRVAEVWVGANFLFGHDRAGNFSLLRALGRRYGFRAEKIDPVRYKDFVVSSTRIRRLISEGRVDEAGALLGHHYTIDGTVVDGRPPRARTIGFPTANLSTENELLPPHGVYATTVRLDGVVYPSVTNIGVRPTFDDAGPDGHRDARARTSSATCTGARFASASCSGCATSGVRQRRPAEGADRRRRPEGADRSSISFRCDR